jgi:hypothetical protein
MGFEILYKYYEKGEDGEYNREELKEKKVKVGKAQEDVPLENVAGRIIAQLARRNILVDDVEIYEFTRKKLSFKEEEDGIKIKNRKFRFDDGASITSEPVIETEEDKLLELLKSNPDFLAKLQAPTSAAPAPGLVKKEIPPGTNVNLASPKRYEIFDPEKADDSPWSLATAQKRGFKLTPGKKYGIFKEETSGSNPLEGMIYTLKDDSGREIKVSSGFFNPQPKPLFGDGQWIEDKTNVVGGNAPAPKLSYTGQKQHDMPVLRR